MLTVVVGAAICALGLGYVFNQSWAASTWPWPDSRYSHLFVGSILDAAAAGTIWIGVMGEWGAIGAGAVTVLVMCGGWAIYLSIQMPNHSGLLPFAATFAVAASIGTIVLVWARQLPIRDGREMPRFLRISFGIFIAVLVVSGAALVMRAAIFPWTLRQDSSVMFGCIFLGDACYFLYALRNPRWHNARAQLLSFLVYDLILIPPFLSRLGTVEPKRLLSLIVYLIVLFYSAVVAIYYLFVDHVTRGWATRETIFPCTEVSGAT